MKQIPMFPEPEPAPREPGSLNPELAAAHRVRTGKRQFTPRRRDGTARIFCPACGSSISIPLAQELAR